MLYKLFEISNFSFIQVQSTKIDSLIFYTLKIFIFMIIDSHAHLDFFKEDEIKKVIENSIKNNVFRIITNSVDLPSSIKSLELSKEFSIVKPAIGLYPPGAIKEEDKEKVIEELKKIKELVLKNKEEIVAIGEIGMDFYHGKREEMEFQEKILIEQLNLAKELNLPSIIHTRGAEKEVLEILEKYSSQKIVIHCFCGNMKLVKKAVEIGCYFSIPCSLKRMQNFLELLKIVPKERILTETDAPYLSPFEGKTNEPAFIKETIKEISKIWNLSIEETEKQIEKNSLEIFNLK